MHMRCIVKGSIRLLHVLQLLDAGRVLQPVPVLDHPLATGKVDASVLVVERDMDGDGGPEVVKGAVDTNRMQQGPSGHGVCLSHSDRDRLRIFINELVTHGLAPWAERTLRVLNDQVCVFSWRIE